MARLDTIRLILALVAQYGSEVHHLNVKSVFLNVASKKKFMLPNLKDSSSN